MMKIAEVTSRAFPMLLTAPTYPKGRYHFVSRKLLVISYRIEPKTLRAVVPRPLEVVDPIEKFEPTRMPDITGFGDYTESGQVFPVRYKGKPGAYVNVMYLHDESSIAGGREIWGFPKKLTDPARWVEKDRRLDTLGLGSVRLAPTSMAYTHEGLDLTAVNAAREMRNYLLTIIPDVDCSPRICSVLRYHPTNVVAKGAWSGQAESQMVAVFSARHILSDLTLGLGTAVCAYLGFAK